MSNLVELVKKYQKINSIYNKEKFLEAYEILADENKKKVVAEDSELSQVMPEWCSMARIEFEMSNLVELAKKYKKFNSIHNEEKFFEAYEMLTDENKKKAVAEDSSLSQVMPAWCSMARIEFE